MTRQIRDRRECQFGVTDAELRAYLGDRYDEFERWMDGQTRTICDGRRWSYERQRYEPTGCGPHGAVTYQWDLDRFLAGRPVID